MAKLYSSLLFLVLVSFPSFLWGQTTTISINATGTWTCPPGVSAATVECWGSGGAGGGVNNAGAQIAAGGGGSGGSYASAVMVVTPLTVYNVTVGAGGAGGTGNGGNGNVTWFNTAGTLEAVGGAGGSGATTTTPGAGAAAVTTGNVGGTTNWYGGAGGTGTPNPNPTVSGAGGGSAGTTADGTAAVAGTAGTGSGSGGAGVVAASANGNAGYVPGAGGSGGRRTTAGTRNGGAGGNGLIMITYVTPPNISPFADLSFCTASYPTGYQTVSFSLKERLVTDFTRNQAGQTIILKLPAGFEFNTGAAHTLTKNGGGSDITALALTSVTTTSITITLSTSAANPNTNFDEIFLNNFQIRATAAAYGDLLRNGGTFLINGSTQQPLSSESFGFMLSNPASVYNASEISQYTTSNINRNCESSRNAVILKLRINVTGGCPPPVVTQFNFSTAGDAGFSQNPATNISAARVYYNGQLPSAPLITSGITPFGSVNNPNGAFTINGSQKLDLGSGDYYFYLVYDVPVTANAGDGVDASMSSFVMDAATISNMATPNPTGKRFITNAACYTPDIPNPPANVEPIPRNSYVIPMDNTNQALVAPFNLKAYGLVHALLLNDIPVKWVILSGKAKDAADFTANTSRIYPTAVPAAAVTFKAGAFIVDSTWINKPYYASGQTATQVINTYTAQGAGFNQVTVFKLTNDENLNVRYTLHQRPKIAVFTNGTASAVHQGYLNEAGITNYILENAGNFTGLAECFTFCSEAHWDFAVNPDINPVDNVISFVNEGGNFLAQCAGIDLYENHQPTGGHFEATKGISFNNTAPVSNSYYNPDMAFNQYEGIVTPDGGTIAKFWPATASSYNAQTYFNLADAVPTATVSSTAIHVAPQDSIGGNVYYLGGHDYLGATIDWINGRRMYLNATLIPAARPTAFTLDPGTNKTICAGQSTTLGGSPTGGSVATNYVWSPSAGLNNTTSANPVASPTVTTIYTVIANDNGCPGGPNTMTVTVNPTPAAPSPAGSNSPLCANLTLSLTATSSGGATYNWSGPNSFISAVQNPTIASVTTAAAGTYSVTTASALGCVSAIATTSVTINPAPNPPVAAASPNPICTGATLNLTATSTGTTYSWTGPNSFTSASQNPAFVVGSTAAAGIYSVTATSGGCNSTVVTTAAVTVTATDDPSFNYSSGTYCQTGANPTPTITGGSAGTFSASPAGLVFVSTSTGQINLSASALNTYSVTFTTNGSCPSNSTVNVTITTAPNASFSYSTPFCQGGTNPFPSFSAGASAGVFSSSPAGLTFVSTATGEVDLSVSTPGTYTITNTIAAAGGCSAASATFAITINTAATANAGADQTICSGSTVTLAGAIGGSAASATWSGGAGSFSPSSSTLNATYTPTAGEIGAGTVTLVLTTNDPAGPCGSAVDNMVITIKLTPAAPVASANPNPVCTGAILSLSASATGTTYSWTGPNSFTSANQNPTLAIASAAATGTYSVTAATNGCTGSAGTVSVAVNVTPAAPAASASPNPVCTGATLSLTASSTATTYNWTGPNSFTSASQNPTLVVGSTAAQGTYSVTGTTGGCTSNSAGTVSVSVTQSPAAPAAGSNSPICIGVDLSLTASSTGTTYNWTGPNSFSSSSQNPVISAAGTVNAGTYSVTAAANGCMSTVATASVVINPPPSPPVLGNNSPICSGNTLSLTSTTVAGASYSWNGPNSFSSASQNPTIVNVTTAASGTYSMTATVPGCPALATVTTSVTINQSPAAPVAGSNSPICVGGDISLTASSTGTTYNWSGPNGFSSTSQNPVIVASGTADGGTYSVTAAAGGCTGNAGTVAVAVNPPPATIVATSSNSPVCVGNTLSLTSATIIAGVYSWVGPNSFSAASQNPTRAGMGAADAGIYSVTVTVPGCASGGSGSTTVTVNPTPSAPIATSNSPICTGNNLSLSASTVGSSTYVWTGPSAFTSGSQNPVIIAATTSNTGTYSVTATENGCTGPAGTVSATINTPPATPTAGNNGPLCIGDNLTLTVNTVAGATYSWNGPNSFTSASQNPVINNAATSDGGTYSVTVTVAGCAGSMGTTTVIVAPPPSAPTPGSNSPVCSGTTLSLTANTISGATYLWSGPNSFSSGSQNPTIAGISTAGGGTYSVFVKIGSCTSPTGTVSVTINQTPPAVPSSNSPLCTGSDLSLSANTIAGGTYAWSGPNSFSSASQNPVVNNVSTADAGTYSLAATANGCTSPTSTVTVTINSPPAAPVAGSNSPVCTGRTLSLTASTIATASYNWSGPNSYTAASQNPTLAGITFAAAGTYSVTATVPGCPTGPVGTVSVTVKQTPAAPLATNSSPICAGSDLSLTSSTVGTSTYSWIGPNSYSSAIQNPVILATTTSNAGTYSVMATENGCISNAGTTNAIVNPIPAAPTAGNNGPLCLGDNLTLTANTISGATYSWNGPNGFSSASQNPVINNVSTVNAGTYSVSVSVSGCPGAVGTTTVIVSPPPAAPSPGSNSPVCSGYMLSLTANNIPGASYVWSGPNSFSSGTQSPTIAGISTAGGGTYSVFVKIGSCTSPSSTVAVTINPSPAAPAVSSNSPLCTGDNLSLTASNVAGVTYSWSGPNSFSSAAQNPLVNNVSTADGGTYTVSVTSIANGCVTNASTTVSVTFPATVNAGADQTVCANNAVALNGTVTGGSGTGIWSTPNGVGVFAPNTTALNASYTPSNNDTVAGNILLILTSTGNGGCATAKDTAVVHVNPGPQVSAGADQSICANNYSSVAINGSVLIASGGTWSSLGTGTFASANTVLTNTYVPTSADSTSGSVVLVLTSTGNGVCSAVTDSLLITFTPAPKVNAGADIPVCFGTTSAQLNGTVSGGATTGIWTTLGTGTFTPTATTLNAIYMMSNADTTAGSVKLILTSTGNGNCVPVTDTVIAFMAPPPVVVAGSDITVCANNDTIFLAGNISGGTTTGYWTSSGTGIFIPDSSALNASYVPSAADTAVGSIKLTLTSTNACAVMKDSLMVTITDAPKVNAGPDIAICGPSTVLLNGTLNSVASGGIWTSSGNGIFVPNNTTLNASYQPGTNDTSIIYLVLTSTGNGQCLAVNDSMRILIGKKPIAGFSNTQACSGQLVTFTDASVMTSVVDTVVTWNWIIGGTTYATQNPTHTYPTAGTDTVTLMITTNTGCADTVTQVVNIHPSPVAAFTHTVNCTADSVYFTNSSTISSGNIISWSWNFGDGTTTSSTPNPAHQYTTTGTYIVSLTVTSDSGCTATISDSVKTCGSVQAGFSSVSVICSGQTISFTDTSVISGNDSIATWNWNFGDGTSTSSVPNPSHTYTSSGTYTVSLVVVTNSGASDTAKHTVVVHPAPSASFTAISSCSADSVHFTNTSTISGGNITSWNWNFGDGNSSTQQNPAHSYSANGTYTVSLTVTSDSGCTSTFIDTILSAKGLVAGFSDSTDCKFNAMFSDTSMVSTGDSVVIWTWNFGDGTSATSVPNPSHTYTASGTYTVQLIATTSGGCSDTVIKTITFVPLPNADFIPAGGAFYQGEQINFTDLSTNPSSWLWNYGDNNNDTIQNPSHTYQSNGNMNVTLIVMNSSGCPDTAKYSFTIYPNTVGVPEAFTPNGDGVNDELHVLGGPMKDMDWRIYNEWGNEVFHATDQKDGWDGKYKGKDQPASRFVYTLKGKTITGGIIDMSGEVNIVR